MKSRQTPVCRDFPVPVSRANVTASVVADPATNARSLLQTRGARYLLADPNTYAIRFDRKSKPAPGGGNDPIPEPISTSAGPVFSLRRTAFGSANEGVSLRGRTTRSASDDDSARETQRVTHYRARPAVGLPHVDCGRLAFLREQFGLGATDHKHRDERGSDHGDCGGNEH